MKISPQYCEIISISFAGVFFRMILQWNDVTLLLLGFIKNHEVFIHDFLISSNKLIRF